MGKAYIYYWNASCLCPGSCSINLVPIYSETQHSCWVQKKQKTGSRGEKTRSSRSKCFWLPQHYTNTTESQAFPLESLTMLSQSPKSTYNTTSHGFFLFLGNKGLLEDDGVWTSLEASCFFLLFHFFFQLLERKPVRQFAMTTTSSMTQVLVLLTASSIKTADYFIYSE